VKSGSSRLGFGPVALYASMLAAVLLAMMDIQVTNAILPILGRDLGASIAQLGTVQTVYLSAEIISILCARALIRSFSSRAVFVSACLGFALASALCSASPTLAAFLASRFLQGLFAGALVPIAADVRFRLFPKERQALIGSIVILVLTAAPTFGPTVGAWITEASSWRVIFSMNVPIALFVAVVVSRGPDIGDARQEGRSPFPWAAALYLTLFAVAAHIVFELVAADRSAWEDGRVPLSLIAIVNLILFTWQSRGSKGFVSLKPLRSTRFTILLIVSGLLTGIQISLNFLIPLFMQTVAGNSIDEAARVLLIGGLAQMVAAPLIWMFLDRIGLMGVLGTGLVMLIFSLTLLCGIAPFWTLSEYALPQVLRGAAYMLIATPTQTVLMESVATEFTADATVLLSAARNLAAMFGVMLAAQYLQVSYDRVVAMGGVTSATFDRAVGADPSAAEGFRALAQAVGFQNVMAILLCLAAAMAIAAVPATWVGSRQTAI
jgi:MFS transporter, DHA2 family, multidrug resistance protein